MDTITHGIAGALIGKGIFADRWGPAAIVASTLGSVFPDSDVVAEAVTHNPLTLLEYHRGITHSMVGMPFFALALGGFVWWLARKWGKRAPFWPLVLAAMAGIASHILLDVLTSWGTRIWDPVSWTRVSWDWLFIVDPTLTALLLVPQVAAWVQSKREKALWRAVAMWALFTILAAIVWAAEWSLGASLAYEIVPVAAVVLAAVFFLPLASGRFFEWSRRGWCLAGLGLTILYVGICGLEHHRALEMVQAFARRQPLPVESLAAVPLPPSPLAWNGLVRTPEGVYTSRIDSADGLRTRFVFVHDAPANPDVEAAFRLPAVQTYLGFARFPIVRYVRSGRENFVDIYDLRFFDFRRANAGRMFTYRAVFNSDGKLVRQGWLARPLLARTP